MAWNFAPSCSLPPSPKLSCWEETDFSRRGLWCSQKRMRDGIRNFGSGTKLREQRNGDSFIVFSLHLSTKEETHVSKNHHGGFGRHRTTGNGSVGANPDRYRSPQCCIVGHGVEFPIARRLARLKGRWSFRLQ